MYIYLYTCIHIYTCVYEYMYIYIYVYVYVVMYMYMHMNMYICICILISHAVCIRMYLYVSATHPYASVCIHVPLLRIRVALLDTCFARPVKQSSSRIILTAPGTATSTRTQPRVASCLQMSQQQELTKI